MKPFSKLINLCILLVFLSIPFNMLMTHANASQHLSISNSNYEQVVLSIIVDIYIVTNSHIAYIDYNSEDIYINLGSLLTDLGYPILIDKKIKSVTWKTKHSINNLSIMDNIAILGSSKKRVKLYEDDYFIEDENIYMKTNVASKLIDAFFNIKLNELSINIVKQSYFPFQIEIEMNKQRKKILNIRESKNNDMINKYIEPIKPYLFTYPFLMLNYKTEFNSKDITRNNFNANGSLKLFRQDLNFNFVAGNDFLSKAYISNVNEKNNLFGYYGTEYKLGNITSGYIPLISKVSNGIGFYYTNEPILGYNSRLNKYLFHGYLLNGSYIDIYNNGILVDHVGKSEDDIEYNKYIDLNPGINILKFDYYDQFGNSRTEEKRIFLHKGLIPPGEFTFNLTYLKNKNNSANLNSDDRFIFDASYGVDSTSNIFFSVVKFSNENNYLSLGFNESIYGVGLGVNVSTSGNNRYATELSLDSKYYGLYWKLKYTNFNKYLSENINLLNHQFVHNKFEFKVNGVMDYKFKLPFNFEYTYVRTKNNFDSKLKMKVYFNYLSKLSIGNTIESRVNSFGDNSNEYLLHLRTRLNNIDLHLSARSDINKLIDFKKITLQGTFDIFNNNFTVGLDRYQRLSNYSYKGYISHNTKINNVRIISGISFDEKKNFKFTIGVKFYLFTKNNSVYFSENSLINKSVIIPTVFFDSNLNNKFDNNENPIENVEISGGRNTKKLTNSNGYLILDNIEPYSNFKININKSTLPTIYMEPGEYVSEIKLTRNHIYNIDIPIIPTGEIDANIYIFSKGKIVNGVSVNLNIINKLSNKIITVTSEFDGLLFKEGITAGNYIASISKDDISKYNFCTPDNKEFSITPNDSYISLGEFNLLKKTDIDITIFKESNLYNLKKAIKKNNEYLKSILFLKEKKYFTELNGYWSIILRDMSQKESKQICNKLKEQKFHCSIITTNKCPSRIVPFT